MSIHALKVLIVDDEPALREVLEIRLSRWGAEIRTAETCREAEELVAQFRPDVVISDVVLPDRTGLELLESLRIGDPDRIVILMTAYGSIDTAVEAMKKGARDYLTKPLDYVELKALLEEAGQEVSLRQYSRELDEVLDHDAGLGPIVGKSTQQMELYRLIKIVAKSDAAVIITGESGTGKELVARTLHELSARKEGPFIPVNAAAIPEGLTEAELLGHEKGAFTGAIAPRPGLFEHAHGGTLFLDEITEMPLSLQPKMLRILEEGHVRRIGGRDEVRFDVRIIAATNREPSEALDQRLLRSDLYFRLNVFTVALAPLRERLDDIQLLVQHFVRQFNVRHQTKILGTRPQVLELLKSYEWPGNVRELRNIIERASVLARESWIEEPHLPPFLRRSEERAAQGIVLPHGVTSAEAERILILETLKQVGNNKAEAARRLGLDVKTIRNKLKSFGIKLSNS